MDIPYSLEVVDEVPSTQDLVRPDRADDTPAVAIAHRQTRGRGRGGSEWENAARSVAVSVGVGRDHIDVADRPVSLMAGVAAVRVAGSGLELKWPNDVLRSGSKLAGILVEATDIGMVVGMGMNLYWPDAPTGVAALFDDDPGPAGVTAVGEAWAQALLEMIQSSGWPHREYIDLCSTIGHDIEWDPAGAGRAVTVGEAGGLVVRSGDRDEVLVAGEVRHIRLSDYPRS